MGLQLIVQAESEQLVTTALDTLAGHSEVFPIEGALWGISVPTKIVNQVGENSVRRRLSVFNLYDLYEGKWKYA